jgi:hypothetical protein
MVASSDVMAITKWSIGELIDVLRNRPQYPDHRQAALLRARRERLGYSRAAEQLAELAPFHSITSSASASNLSGTSRPSAFAVLRFMIISNLVGSSEFPLHIHCRYRVTRGERDNLLPAGGEQRVGSLSGARPASALSAPRKRCLSRFQSTR